MRVVRSRAPEACSSIMHRRLVRDGVGRNIREQRVGATAVVDDHSSESSRAMLELRGGAGVVYP